MIRLEVEGSRKVCADNRPRIKGKFVKVGSTPDLGALDMLGDDEGPTQAGPETLSDVEEDSFASPVWYSQTGCRSATFAAWICESSENCSPLLSPR